MTKAGINPGPEQKVIRNAARITRLRQSIEKARHRGDGDRALSLQAEIDRRQAELYALKATIDATIK